MKQNRQPFSGVFRLPKKYEPYREVLGRAVTVTVDRPMGGAHPRVPALIYPINYGYVKGIIAGDGSAQDAYLLGLPGPVTEFTGRVIAVIHRLDDVEDKWVVAPDGMEFYLPEIQEQTRFVEQFFQTEYFCLYEKVCGAVAVSFSSGEARYLLIENNSGHIGFPKGHVEAGETELGTALREVREETGLLLAPFEGFRQSYRYSAGNLIQKTGVYFLASFRGDAISPQAGEVGRWWLESYEGAMAMLNFSPDRPVLEKTWVFLHNRG